MDDTGIVVAFWILAVITVGSALAIVAVRNLIHAMIFLVISFVSVAGLYITLSADFIAVTQILIYAGAVSVLFLFAIVLTPIAGRDNSETFMRLPALLLCTLVAATLIFVAIDTTWPVEVRPHFDETASVIGDLLFDQYVLALQVAAVLLVVAMVGAILLVRPEPPTSEGEE